MSLGLADCPQVFRGVHMGHYHADDTPNSLQTLLGLNSATSFLGHWDQRIRGRLSWIQQIQTSLDWKANIAAFRQPLALAIMTERAWHFGESDAVTTICSSTSRNQRFQNTTFHCLPHSNVWKMLESEPPSTMGHIL